MPLDNEPVDIGNEAGSGGFTPDPAASLLSPVYAPAGGGGLGNDPSDIGNDPGSGNVFASAIIPGPSQTLGPIPVGYSPDANAAFSITPGTLDNQNVFTPGSVTYGPYPAVVTLIAGQYALTVTTSDPALPSPLTGAVSVQPGDLTGGVFSAIGAAVVGTIGPDAPPAIADDINLLSVSGPYTDIDAQTSILAFGSTDFVHVGVSAQATSGAIYDVANTQADILIGDLLTGVWQPAVWETEEDGGSYATLLVTASGLSANAGNWQSGFWYMVWIRLTIGNVTKIRRVGRLILSTS